MNLLTATYYRLFKGYIITKIIHIVPLSVWYSMICNVHPLLICGGMIILWRIF